MIHLKQFGESYYRIQWCTYLVAHVVQEGVLHCLYLLGTNRLQCQFLFHGLDITDVTNQSEVFHYLSILIGGHKVKLQVQGYVVLAPDASLDFCSQTAGLLIIHLVQYAQCLFL